MFSSVKKSNLNKMWFTQNIHQHSWPILHMFSARFTHSRTKQLFLESESGKKGQKSRIVV